MDAEARKAELAAQKEGSGLLFKMKSDPRITRVGRRHEHRGTAASVARRGHRLRRHGVPPPVHQAGHHRTVAAGGRSNLTRDESVRLDLRYVENWSVMTDLTIMWRTVKVMLAPEGAY